MHKINAEERAVRTWTNIFVSGLSGTDNLFPMYLWDIIIDQAYITLNMLIPSRRNPMIPAHVMMEGNFELNKTPLEPPNTKNIVNKTPKRRRT